jgi:hypothetical protein
MTIRHALFIDGAWTDVGGESLTALVRVDETGIEIMSYVNAEVWDVVRFTFEEFAAIAEMVSRVQKEAAPMLPEATIS